MRFILCLVAIFGIGLCDDKTINNTPDIEKRTIVFKTLEIADNRRNVQERSNADAASDFGADETLDLSERSNFGKYDRVDDLSQAPQTEDNEDIQERSEGEEDDSPEIENDNEIEERSELNESPEIEDDDNKEERSEEDESHQTKDNEDREEKSVVEESPEIEDDENENISERSNMDELSDEDETEVVDKRFEGKDTPEVEDDNNSIEDNQERTGRSENDKDEKKNASERLAAIKNLKIQLKEAKKNFKTAVIACGIKHKFDPFRDCRKCQSKCKDLKSRKCSSCKPICRADRKEFRSKGCITDRRKIRLLRKMIKKIRGVAKKLGDSKIFLPDL